MDEEQVPSDAGMSRREVFRLGAGAAAVVAGLSALTVAQSAEAAGKGGTASLSSFRMTVDGEPVTQARAVEFGPVRMQLSRIGDPPEVVYDGAEPSVLLRVEVSSNRREPVLERWYDETRDAGYATRQVRLEILTGNMTTVVRAYSMSDALLERFEPAVLEPGKSSSGTDAYILRCPMGLGELRIEEEN